MNHRAIILAVVAFAAWAVFAACNSPRTAHADPPCHGQRVTGTIRQDGYSNPYHIDLCFGPVRP